jgi:hypothetical protein
MNHQFLSRLRIAQNKAYRYQCIITIHVNKVQMYVYPDGHIQNQNFLNDEK